MMELGVRLEPGGDYDVLRCPVCDGNNLHHRGIVIRSRADEDGPGVKLGVARDGRRKELPLTADAPEWHGRRDELSISFDCEGCAFVGWLLIMQHKGQTLLAWRDAA